MNDSFVGIQGIYEPENMGVHCLTGSQGPQGSKGEHSHSGCCRGAEGDTGVNGYSGVSGKERFYDKFLKRNRNKNG